MILEESGEFCCFLDDSGDSFLAGTKKTVWTRIHIKQSFVNLYILAPRRGWIYFFWGGAAEINKQFN